MTDFEAKLLAVLPTNRSVTTYYVRKRMGLPTKGSQTVDSETIRVGLRALVRKGLAEKQRVNRSFYWRKVSGDPIPPTQSRQDAPTTTLNSRRPDAPSVESPFTDADVARMLPDCDNKLGLELVAKRERYGSWTTEQRYWAHRIVVEAGGEKRTETPDKVEGIPESKTEDELKLMKESDETKARAKTEREAEKSDKNKIYDRLVTLVGARKNSLLVGPTGCGKTYICDQVAKELGMRFGFISCSAGMSEGHLTGRLLPIGDGGRFEYVISEFIDIYENGGLFLLDEADAADANVLLVINAALANGKVPVPNRPEKPYAERHPDFVCVIAANTWGTGADRLYTGRNQLDAATLDRFLIGKLEMGYDKAVERTLCPNKPLLNRLWGYREAIKEHRLERTLSTRFIKDAYEMVFNCGWTMKEVDEAYFAGWREDEVNKVQNHR